MTTNEIPAKLADFINALESNGCTVTRDGDRNRWEVTCDLRWRDVEGNINVHPHNLGSFGYYVRDGRAHISGTRNVAENFNLRKRQMA